MELIRITATDYSRMSTDALRHYARIDREAWYELISRQQCACQ